MHSEDRTWTYGPASRIAVAFFVVLIFGVAALFFALPVILGGVDRSGLWFVEGTGVVIAGFGVFMAFGLIVFVRTRLSLVTGLGGMSLEATVPDGHNRLLVPRFRTIRLPVREIGSVERRVEVFRTFGLTSMRESLSIVTAGGERIGLFSNANGSLNRLPLGEIAATIAAAAGVAVTDDGTVLTKARGLYGEASSTWNERPLDAASATKARRAAMRTLQILVALMTLGFILRACT
jgi:hypothetical protein